MKDRTGAGIIPSRSTQNECLKHRLTASSKASFHLAENYSVFTKHPLLNIALERHGRLHWNRDGVHKTTT